MRVTCANDPTLTQRRKDFNPDFAPSRESLVGCGFAALPTAAEFQSVQIGVSQDESQSNCLA